MSENTFDSQEINLQFQPLPAFIDTDGSFKLNTPMLSSFDFDGSIPKRDEPVDAIEVKPGYLIQIESGGEYFPVVSVEYDEPDIEDTGIVTINYIDDQGNTISADYDETDQISAVYEDWDEKVLGSQGWGITAGGNAIFTNVAVRGDLEATTLNVGGDDGITYDGTEVIIGASVSILGSLTIGDVTNYLQTASYTTQEDLDDLDFLLPEDVFITGTTNISGGRIRTGQIESAGYSGGNVLGTTFSTSGMSINLDYGSITSKNFRVDYLGNGFFTGDVAVTSLLGNTSASVYITRNAIVDGGASFPGIELRYNYLNTFVGRGYLGYGLSGSLPALRLSTDGSGPMQIYPGGDLYIQTTYGSIYINDDLNITGTVGGTNNLVVTNGDYANPSWLLTLAGSKITGNISGDANNITEYNINQNLGTGNNVRHNDVTVDGRLFCVDAYTANVSARPLYVNSNGRFGNPSSSYKIKKNIVPLTKTDNTFNTIVPSDKFSIESVDTSYKNILSITPVKFEWNIEDQPDGPEFGFIAEEILEKMPESGLPAENGGLPYYKITSILASMLAVVKDQQEIIDDLQNRVLQLETQLGG